MPALDDYLNDLPLLHTWDGGQTWNTGGFNARVLGQLHRTITEHFGSRRLRILETGAGNSTILFLHMNVECVMSICPDQELRDRILAYCTAHGLSSTALDYRPQRSEFELPLTALQQDPPQFDVALIDGGHGWPTVFVDFCYAHLMLVSGGLLIVDDLQIHSVAELSRLLDAQPGFRLEARWRKTEVWVKETDRKFLPEHSREPYIAEMSRRMREQAG